MKKITYLFILFAFLTMFLVSCTKADYTIGILQYVTHDALDKATNGFVEQVKEEMEKEGKTVEFIIKNPQTDETALTSMANQLVKKCDLVLGNATPAATALKSAAKKSGKNIPILFTSVTDPVEVALVESNEVPGGNCTGTSDMNPIKEQMNLIFEVDSTVDKIGFLYTATETNSVVQCDTAKAYLKEHFGFTDENLLTKAFNQASELSASVTYLCDNGADCIYLPTDNIVASAISTITKITNQKHVFLMAGEESMVTAGATFTYSIDYYKLGKTTGHMAFEVLKGADISKMSVQTQTADLKFSYSKEAIKLLELNLSQEFINKYHIELD